jgi:endonuclease I
LALLGAVITEFFVVFILTILACGGAGDDTSGVNDSTVMDTANDTSSTEPEPCYDFTEEIADCDSRVESIESGAGDYYGTVNVDSTTLHRDLSAIIDDHTTVSYDNLWDYFQFTDMREDGTVWDIYSTLEDGTAPYYYQMNDDQCGEYSGEGYCYNREHVWPKAWFGGGSPMKSDLHHLYPTDGYVNGRRSSSPFGVVDHAIWTSQNGGRLGGSDQCGTEHGTVFEPADSFKGDLARVFFYMSVRYGLEDENWDSSFAVDGATIEQWEEDVLRTWHIMDPVSQKEIDRNEAVFGIQGNRNPFVDHPEWVCLIEDF